VDRRLFADALMLGLMLFPAVLFYLGVQSVTYSGSLRASPGGFKQDFRAELGFPIVMTTESNGSRIYFRRDHDPKLVREALGRRGGDN